MAWIAVSKSILGNKNVEFMFSVKPIRVSDEHGEYWGYDDNTCMMCEFQCISMPKGSIKKLIGKYLTWEDEPIELK